MYIKGFRQKHKWNYCIRWGLVLLSLAGLAGCSPMAVDQGHSPCDLENGKAYIYSLEMLPLIKTQFDQANQSEILTGQLSPTLPAEVQTAIPSGFFNDPPVAQMPVTPPTEAQINAFKYLVNETKHATDLMPINFGNAGKAYVVVTFLSPLLIQMVYFSEYLYKTKSAKGFEESLNTSITKVVQRKELLFLVTIISSNYDPFNTSSTTLTIPVKAMLLANSDGLKITPRHYDRNLDEAFEASQIFESGILGYSLGVQDNGKCAWVLDPTYNQNIVIVGSNIDNGTGKPISHTWTIPYESLVNPAGNAIPDVELRKYYGPSTSIEPSDAPPIPPDKYETDIAFWQNLARFIWGRVIQGH